MKKNSLDLYVCSECGEEYSRWQGRCDNCQAWNSLKPFSAPAGQTRARSKDFAEPIKLNSALDIQNKRISTASPEFDRALSGGLVAGSFTLLGGDPGIGKSTLMLQVAHSVSNSLYVSGEESPSQVALRAKRLNLNLSRINFLNETNISGIVKTIVKLKPRLVVIDSIQTMYDENFPSTPGSIVQVRECAAILGQTAKSSGIPIIIVGHVTKEGTVAGPKMLEHLVDTVCYLEGKGDQDVRLVRTIKHRFGSTNEIGLFLMTDKGLKSLENPSSHFINERLFGAAGSVLSAVVDGNRVFIVEVQALTAPSGLGYQKRVASGFDARRLDLLVAILERRAGMKLDNQDIFVNLVGGLTVKDPSVDLAVGAAIYSSLYQKSPPHKLVVFGELGLTGEIRTVSASASRMKEIKRLGLEFFAPPATVDGALIELFSEPIAKVHQERNRDDFRRKTKTRKEPSSKGGR